MVEAAEIADVVGLVQVRDAYIYLLCEFCVSKEFQGQFLTGQKHANQHSAA